MGTQAYCIYARLNLFPEDSTRSREQIFGHDIATRSRRHRHIVWIFDDISELFYRATNRIIRVYTLSSSSKEVSYSNDENWLIRSRLITRWNLGNLSKGGYFLVSRTIFHSVTIDIRIHWDEKYSLSRRIYMINAKREARKLRGEQG